MSRKYALTEFPNLIDLYQSGHSCGTLAKRFGVSHNAIHRLLSSTGITVEPRNRHRLPEDEIIALYNQGVSENKLSRQFHIARSGIRSRLLAAGVEIRGQTEANRLMMSRRTSEEHRANISAFHAALRGRTHSVEEKIRRANTRQSRLLGVSGDEMIMAEWLKRRGIEVIPQQAVHTYNVDLGAFPVAVEIFGGGWHAYGDHAAIFRQRTNYLLDAGWSVLFIWVDRRYHPLRECSADYAVRFIEETRSHPSPRGKYRMIWGDGEVMTSDCFKFQKLALIES